MERIYLDPYLEDYFERGRLRSMAEYRQMYSMIASTIYVQIKGLGLLPPTRPIRKDPVLLDRQRYYEYHSSIGHKKDECHDLVNTLIKACDDWGLRKFMTNKWQDDVAHPDLILALPTQGSNGHDIFIFGEEAGPF